MSTDCNYIIEDQEHISEIVLDISKKIVARYASLKIIPQRERQDVEMTLVEKFLLQKEKINGNFKGKAKITTYYTAILNRMCCEIIRKEKKHWYALLEEKGEKEENNKSGITEQEAEKNLFIADEVKRLSKILILMKHERAKIVLFLKYYFDIPVLNTDIKEYSRSEHCVIGQIFSIRSDLSKAEVFDNMARVVQLAEGKKVSGDAVRMWLKKKIVLITDLLNSASTSTHDDESLSFLMELQRLDQPK